MSNKLPCSIRWNLTLLLGGMFTPIYTNSSPAPGVPKMMSTNVHLAGVEEDMYAGNPANDPPASSLTSASPPASA